MSLSRRHLVLALLTVMAAPARAAAPDQPPREQAPATEQNVPAPIDTFLRTQGAESEEARLQKEKAAEAQRELERTRAALDQEKLARLKTQAEELLARLEARTKERRPPTTDEGFQWLTEMKDATAAHEKAVRLLGSIKTEVQKLRSLSDLSAAAASSRLIEAEAGQARAELDARDKHMDAAIDSVQRAYLKNQALVVSGGISLGSYQAGFLYYYTLHLKTNALRIAREAHNPAIIDTGRFRIATGASAGSINSFLALIVGCMPGQYDPEKSPFFWVWNGVGISELARVPEVGTSGILSRRSIVEAVTKVEELLSQEEFPAECRSVMGITATRLVPRTMQYVDGGAAAATSVGLKRQTEKFVLSLDLHGKSHSDFRTHRLSTDAFVEEIYPTLGDHRGQASPVNLAVKRADVMTLLQGSAAFPVAFEPLAIPTTVWRKEGPAFELPLYTDGGFLDNTPLELAYKIATSPSSAGKEAVEPPVLFLKSDAVTWRPGVPPPVPAPVGGKEPRVHKANSIFGSFVPFLFELINGASDGQLLDALEKGSLKKLERRVPGRRMPVTGDFLAHFGAFIDSDFRRFDFYQGMADAHDYLRDVSGYSRDEHVAGQMKSPLFSCVLAYRNQRTAATPAPRVSAACRATLGENLTALLESSAEHIVKVNQARLDGTEEFDSFFDALYDRGFKYTALAKGRPLSALTVKLRLRDRVQALAGPLRNNQGDELSKLGASLLGKTLPNEFAYRPASYCGVGFIQGLEVACSYVGLRSPRLAWRLTPVGRYFRPTEYWRSFATLRDRTTTVAMSASALTQLEVAPWSALQLELGGGYRVRWLWKSLYQGSLAGLIPEKPMMWRHGVEWGFGLVFFQRAYLAYSGAYYFDRCAFDNHCSQVSTPYQGFDEPLATSRQDHNLSAGLRFIF